MKSILLVLTALASATSATPVFENDANHSIIGFKASTILFDVPGRFEKYNIDVTGDPDKPEGAKVRIEIEAASVNTNNAKRDEHLRTADFFNIEKHPKIVFTSDKVEKKDGVLTVTGTLDMHGKQVKVTIPFKEVVAVNGGGYREWVYKGTTSLKRSAFGIGTESVAAKISLSDDVQLDLLLAGFFETPAKKTK